MAHETALKSRGTQLPRMARVQTVHPEVIACETSRTSRQRLNSSLSSPPDFAASISSKMARVSTFWSFVSLFERSSSMGSK